MENIQEKLNDRGLVKVLRYNTKNTIPIKQKHDKLYFIYHVTLFRIKRKTK